MECFIFVFFLDGRKPLNSSSSSSSLSGLCLKVADMTRHWGLLSHTPTHQVPHTDFVRLTLGGLPSPTRIVMYPVQGDRNLYSVRIIPTRCLPGSIYIHTSIPYILILLHPHPKT